MDQPLIIQYFDYLKGVVQGDFGPSFRYPGRSVTELISIGLPITFELALYSILFALAIGIFAVILGPAALAATTPPIISARAMTVRINVRYIFFVLLEFNPYKVGLEL